MKSNFDLCLREVLRHEGGFADHPADPGGATNKGITIGTYAGWKGRKVTKAELRAISDAEVAAIYRRKYWDAVRGDDMPAGLDLVAFDAAVNSGPARGAKWLQQGLGVAADGKIGKATLRAARGSARAYDPVVVIKRACAARMGFLRGLRTWGSFGKGWSRRVAQVEAFAVGLAGQAVVAPREAATARTKAERETQGAVVPAAGGAGGFSIEGMPDWGIWVIAALAVVAVVMMLGRARHDRHRAEAYEQLAMEA